MSQATELRERIDDLALRIVLGSQESGVNMPAWVSALETIVACALQNGAAPVAAQASRILEDLKGDTGKAVDGAVLQEAMTALQQAMETQEGAPSAATQSLAQDPELLSDFVLESREHLANLETQLLILERDPHDSEALHSVFRSFHTIKGLAGFLELWEIQKLAHDVESVLDRARNSELTVTAAAIDVILASADYVRRWLNHLESGLQKRPSEAPARDEDLLCRVAGISSAESASAAPHTELGKLAAAVETSTESAAPASELPPKTTRLRETMAVKVNTAKLDYLVDMAGEMVIAQALVRHDPELGQIKTPRLQRNLAQLNRITAELQRTAMAMRLVPIGSLFRKMARPVRDLSRQFGKTVELKTEGDDIELDRTIAEELGDPLMHMVRNSLDHGIESPAERKAHGKSESAVLLLKAQHQAGQILVEISDDGRGLNREKIVAKAIEKGLIASGETLSDNEIYNLVFRPGFSTASQVTNVSGRGVGMDVVQLHISKLRGRIEIRSTPGQGASFVLKLPLTLAIIDGLVVGVGKERYIVPLFAIREMFRPREQTIWTVQERAEMALVRGSLLPVLRLYRKFGVKPRSEDPLQSVLVVAEVESQRFCLLVDELIGKQEVVIKSLGETFRDVTGLAGGAILGDGRVGLILDLDRLFMDKTGDAGR